MLFRALARWALAAAVVLPVLFGEPVGSVAAETTAANPTADLKTRLEKDLRARRPVEFAFIARVIELVDKGKLPLAMVNKTYLWARRQPTHPFQYFQRAMLVQAEKIGVDI